MHCTYTAEGGFKITQITSQLQTYANIMFCQISLLLAPLSSEHYLPACLLSMSAVFSSDHGNKEDWLSRMSRKCCEDNRMCPGSAVEGRRIQGSYCTLWNGLRNARCLLFLFFFLCLSRITCWRRQALKIMWPCVIHGWHCAGTRMFVVTHLDIPPWQPEAFTDRNKTSISSYSGDGQRRLAMTARQMGNLSPENTDEKCGPYNLNGGWLSAKTAINSVSHQNLSDREFQIQ